jgi:hypothetical protein
MGSAPPIHKRGQLTYAGDAQGGIARDSKCGIWKSAMLALTSAPGYYLVGSRRQYILYGMWIIPTRAASSIVPGWLRAARIFEGSVTAFTVVLLRVENPFPRPFCNDEII